MGKWNHRSRFQRRRSPMRWYSDRHSSYPSGYGEDDGIPVWEKKFCEVIGSVPWQKVVEASTFKSWYQGNVITWNDSACEQTFHNEKKRFWSQVNGIHCDTSLPDPNLYISEVDWDTCIDPELMRDVEQAYFAPPDDGKSGFKRGRQDKNWSGCNLVPIEETRMLNCPWEGSDKFHEINEGEKQNGWDVTESSTDHTKDQVRSWEAKPSRGNEKANDTTSGDCLSNRWETDKWRENAGQGNNGWDKSEHQNKKAKGSESVSAKWSELIENPWEAKPVCGTKEAAWGACSSKGWEDSGWGSGGWENREVKEWHSHDTREHKGYNSWKVGFVPGNAALRDDGSYAGGWQTHRSSEGKQRNWDVKRSSDGWGRKIKERDDDLYGYNTNYSNSRYRRDDHHNSRYRRDDHHNSRYRRDDHHNRKVNFSAK